MCLWFDDLHGAASRAWEEQRPAPTHLTRVGPSIPWPSPVTTTAHAHQCASECGDPAPLDNGVSEYLVTDS